MYQKWLDRVDNLLQVQRDQCLDLISANFTRRELIELKMMVETLMEYTAEKGLSDGTPLTPTQWRIIHRIDTLYAKAKALGYIRKPLAWALYKVWKEEDERSGKE